MNDTNDTPAAVAAHTPAAPAADGDRCHHCGRERPTQERPTQNGRKRLCADCDWMYANFDA